MGIFINDEHYQLDVSLEDQKQAALRRRKVF
jgi:hypothetical protein